LLIVAADDSDEFHRQSREMSEFWKGIGAAAELVVPADLDHFDVVNQLRDPNCELVRLQIRHIRRCFPL
jgi:arylformamidase